MRWSEFAARQSLLAAVAEDQLITPGVLLIGTTRRDGSARISGVEPLIMDGDLWLSMMPASAKSRDLHRDPRILLHSIITSPATAPPRRLRLNSRGSAESSTDSSRSAHGSGTWRAHRPPVR
jgi:hypothetical protein